MGFARIRSATSPAIVTALWRSIEVYDKTGNRLGMGAGYYDRQLETLRDLHRPYRLGIAYSLQQVSLIRKNDWDVPLHGLVNEQGWISFH